MEFIKDYLPWILSIITIHMTLMAGNKHKWTWLVGLTNQILWLTWIIAAKAWGLLPMTTVLCFVYGRNHFKWKRDTKEINNII